MTESFQVVPVEKHNRLVEAAYRHRGYMADESAVAAEFAAYTSRHGNRSHNALKALDLDHRFGSGGTGCVPGAQIQKHTSRFATTQVWNANRKLGQPVAREAIETCIQLADTYGVGIVSVDQAFHYLWGGGYVLEAAHRGYLAYTQCTAALAEVVPYGGVSPTLGTNPHSWAFPTTESIGFPILIDWATSVLSKGRIQQYAREGRALPAEAALDAEGRPTTDAAQAERLLPFGGPKGYGLGLVNELVAAFIGGSLPTLRCRAPIAGEKQTPNFFFQVIHPDAVSAGAFARGRSQAENVKAVLEDILGHGNDGCCLPGHTAATAARQSDELGGLLFTPSEIEAFNTLAVECGQPSWDPSTFKTIHSS